MSCLLLVQEYMYEVTQIVIIVKPTIKFTRCNVARLGNLASGGGFCLLINCKYIFGFYYNSTRYNALAFFSVGLP